VEDSASWWAPHLKSGLSQGDVVSPVLIGAAQLPIVYLNKGPVLKDNVQTWTRSTSFVSNPGDGLGNFLGKGRINHALIVSHDCEIDKARRVSRILVAPVSPLANVTDTMVRQAIIEQRRFATMPLPNLPTLGDCYADLRLLMWIDRKLIEDAGKRVASMTDEAVIRLQAQLIGFFTRKDPSGIQNVQ
jgi:hypothetical protein